MSNKLEIYTGMLSYKSIDFSFVFDGIDLRLIPPEDKKREVFMWFIKSENGAYTLENLVCPECNYFIGRCNETCQKIIFLPKYAYIRSCNSVLIISIAAYIIQKYDRQWIDRLNFTSREIDCIYPVNQALKSREWTEDGVVSVKTKDFDDTTSNMQNFFVEGKKISVSFGISRTSSSKIPLKLHSAMYFEFEKTDDYAFILKLWKIAEKFIQYLCYRKNVNLTTVELFAPYSDEKHEKFATMYIVEKDIDDEIEILEKGRYIKQLYICGVEGKILNDIAEGSIYLRHIPETYRMRKNIDAARFVMITAAFEWIFRKIYPNGIVKKETTIEAENEVHAVLTEYVHKSTGKTKEIYKFLIKQIKSTPLKSEIEKTGEDYDDIVGIFGKHVYSMNGEELKYNEMGARLSNQRNNFAHGNLDKEFADAAVLDLVYLECIIYAMQLKEYGIEKNFIQKAINDLFGYSLIR